MKIPFFTLFVLLFVTASFAEPVFYNGTVKTTASFTNQSLDARFGSEFISSAARTFPVSFNGSNAGSVRVEFNFNNVNFTGGQISLYGGLGGSASLRVDSIKEKLILESLSLGSGTDPLSKFKLDRGLERSYFGDVISGGSKIGTFSFSILLQGIESGTTSFSASNVNVNIISNFEALEEQLAYVTNQFAGFVENKDRSPVTSGFVLAIAGEESLSANIFPLQGRGAYGLSGSPLRISGLLGTRVEFFIGDTKVGASTFKADNNVRRVDLSTANFQSSNNFADFDFDGVPNSQDECPNTYNAAVNAQGCSCPQLIALHDNLGSCVVTADLGPVWSPPPPPTSPKPECEENQRGKCLDNSPSFCTEEGVVENRCDICGCPSNFDCNPAVEGEKPITDGNCYKTIQTTNLTCFKNNYFVAPKGTDCTTYGPNFVDFLSDPKNFQDLNNYIGVYVRTNFWAGGSNRRRARKAAQKKLSYNTVCIDTQNIGCVVPDAFCSGEEQMHDSFSDVVTSLQRVVDDAPLRRKRATSTGATVAGRPGAWFPGIGPIINAIGSWCCGSIDISYTVNADTVQQTSLRRVTPCNVELVKPKDSCSALVNKGNSQDQFDLFFIGNGFKSEFDFNDTINKILDYEGNFSGTRSEGVFSRAPFKSQKNKFNIWLTYKKSLDLVPLSQDPSKGMIPSRRAVEDENKKCSVRDLTIVVSKDIPHYSGCVTPKLCYFSYTSSDFLGRQFLKFLAQSLGVAREDFFEIEQFAGVSSVDDFDNLQVLSSPNCARSLGAAKSKWGSLAVPGESIDFFESCGGECGPECKEYIRPTFNSAMNNISARCTTNCEVGPPFDPFYIVNEAHILKRLEDLGDPNFEKDIIPGFSVPKEFEEILNSTK